ncbi:hypothetical protein BKA70DRAFT_1482477 [Coprinopsis sp. MPI-PUGE-AT-0042]|nr:hypothetical protein BKA70DRAFT_1482477 [Coprinopsis sp. MPI-PUGE-AT-0042]
MQLPDSRPPVPLLLRAQLQAKSPLPSCSSPPPSPYLASANGGPSIDALHDQLRGGPLHWAHKGLRAGSPRHLPPIFLPPSKSPQLSVAHLPLMYEQTNGKMVCRACTTRRNDPNEDSKRVKITTFETSASFPQMIEHYAEEHPVNSGRNLSLNRAQIAEIQQRIRDEPVS